MLGSSSKSVLVCGTAFAALMCPAVPAQAQSTQPEQETPGEASTPTGAEKPTQDADLTTTNTVDEGADEIIVTGSRIRRDPNDSALPLQIVTTEEMQRVGIASPEQLIMYLPTNGTAGDNLASNADVVAGQQRGNNAASFANLRGQGSGATLVLLNGRRVAAHGLQGSAVDVNQIPFGMVERVEVLKEGASAIYGTDAIGGVINFILRKDYQGFGVTGFSDFTRLGDHTNYRTTAMGGYGDLQESGFNIMGGVSYSKSPELRGEERDFVNTFQPDRGLSVDTRGTPHGTILPLGVGPNTPLGTIIVTGGSSTTPWVPGEAPFIPGTTTRASGGLNVLDLPGGEGCDAFDGMQPYDTALWAFPQAEFACAWDTGRAAVLQQPLETLTWLGRGVVALGAHELFAEATGSDATASKRFSNIQLIPNTSTQNYAHPSTGENYDAIFDRLVAAFPELESRRGLPIGYRWRCIECGRREISTDTQTKRFSLGAEGPIFGGWDYRAGASRASSKSKSELGSGYYFRGTTSTGTNEAGAPIAPGFTQAGLVGVLNSGLINPFLLPGQRQSQAALDALEAVSAEGVVLYGGKYTLNQLDASVSGGLFDLPGGRVRAAFGADYRKEKYRFNGDEREAEARATIIGAPFDDANALEGVSRNIKAGYVEVLFPILDTLEVTLAGRIDDYSDFGTTKNPMASFKFRPIEPLMFRGNYNTAFRAPTFNQIYNGTLVSLFSGRDLADPETCPGGVPNTTDPGCASLERQIDIIDGGNENLGPETAKMWSLGVVVEPARYFSASVDLWNINREDNVQRLTLRQLVDNYSFFEHRFIRDSAGTLVAIDQRWLNTGGTKTRGVEIALRGGGDVLGGRLLGGLDGTWLLKKKEQAIQGAEFEDMLGEFSFSGDLGLRWKHNAFVSFGQDRWTLALTQMFRSGYENQQLPGVASGEIDPPNDEERVNRYVIYNLSAAFDVNERMRFTVGVKNLFDKDPPFAVTYDSNTGAGSSWEPRVADPRGRAFTIMADAKF